MRYVGAESQILSTAKPILDANLAHQHRELAMADSDLHNVGSSNKDELELLKLRQEINNLLQEEEKAELELADLQRPYLFRNPQLFTAVIATFAALITAAGAFVGAYILSQQNYFTGLKARADWLTELANNRQDQAHVLSRQAEQQVAASKFLIDKSDKAAKEADERRAQSEAEARAQGVLARNAAVATQDMQRRADVAQRNWFMALGLPGWLAGKLDHISRFHTTGNLHDFIWLTPGTTELQSAIIGHPDLRSSLAKITKVSFSWEIPGGSIDAPQALSVDYLPESITSLSLTIYATGHNPVIDFYGLTRLKHLREFDLKVPLAAKLDGLREQNAGFQQLESMPECKRIALTVSGDFSWFPAQLADRVRSLTIGLGIEEITSQDLDLVSQMTNLEALKVEDRRAILNAANKAAGLKSLTYRKVFDDMPRKGDVPRRGAGYVPFTDDDLAQISNFQQLENLRVFSGHFNLSNPTKAKLPLLKTLYVEGLDSSILDLISLFPDADLSVMLHLGFRPEEAQKTIAKLARMPRLKRLGVRGNLWHLGTIGPGDFGKLEALMIEGSMGQNSDLAQLQQLKDLTLIDYPADFDICNLTRLERLELLHNSSDSVPPTCSRGLATLKHLGMTDWGSNCSKWSDFYTKVTAGASLKSLEISFCELPSIPPSVEDLGLNSLELGNLYDKNRSATSF